MPRLPRFSLLLFVSFFALSLTADEFAQIYVSPRVPTTETPIEFRYTTICGDGEPTISRNGNVITLVFSPGPCSPPIFDVARVFLPEGTLPAGQYRVDLVGRQSPPHANYTVASATFTVRPSAVGFRVRPAAVFYSDRVRIESLSANEVCPATCTILFGNQPATDIVRNADGSVTVTTPALAPGVHDLSIRSGGHLPVDLVTPAALYVFNENSRFDATQFERVLLPIYFNGPGSHGSLWITEQVISNLRPWTIPTGHIEQSLSMVWFNRAIESNAYYPETVFGSATGFGLLLPRSDANDVAIATRVRDVSREAEGYGTEIPAVREREMAYNTSLPLLNVPLEPEYRVKLRVYAFLDDVRTDHAIVRIQPRRGSAEAFSQPVVLRRICTGTCAEEPLYGELDLPSVPDGRADVHVEGPAEALTWAFITVTNNTTQQVTTVTPGGNGGVPGPRPN